METSEPIEANRDTMPQSLFDLDQRGAQGAETSASGQKLPWRTMPRLAR